MSGPIMSYNNLHSIVYDNIRKRDEEIIGRIVDQIYNMVIQAAQNRTFSVKWSRLNSVFDDISSYEHKHIVIATNRLSVLFPDTNVCHNKMKEITVEWY